MLGNASSRLSGEFCAPSAVSTRRPGMFMGPVTRPKGGVYDSGTRLANAPCFFTSYVHTVPVTQSGSCSVLPESKRCSEGESKYQQDILRKYLCRKASEVKQAQPDK